MKQFIHRNLSYLDWDKIESIDMVDRKKYYPRPPTVTSMDEENELEGYSVTL